MSGRGSGRHLGIIALLLGLWLVPVWAQQQPPELESIYKRGLQLYQAGKYAEAIPVVEEYIAVAAAKFGEEHPLYAGGLGALGVLYHKLGRMGDAEPLLKRALTIKEKALGPVHIEVADALNDLAELYQEQGRLSEAESLYQRVLSIAEKAMGPEHTSVGMVLGNLAELYRTQGRHAQAEPLAKRSRAIREKSPGPAQASGGPNADEPASLLAEFNQLYQAGKYAQAIPIAERLIQLIEARHGKEGTEYALALNNLGELFRVTNRLAEAEPLLRLALVIDERVSGPEHPKVAVRLNNLGLLLKATNRLAEAEPLLRRALVINENRFGPDHPAVAHGLNNLAQLLHDTDRLAEAEPLLRRALSIDEEASGPEHPDVAIRLNNLAQLLQATNRLADAEPLMRRALAIDEKSFGPNHPNVARDLGNLAVLLEEGFSRYEESEKLKRRALSIDESSFGPDHPKVAISLNNLAALLQAINRAAEAEPLMRRALAIDESSFGPGHPAVARDLNNLAGLLQLTNRLAEAEPLMRRALAIDEKSFGPEHSAIAQRLNNLAQLLNNSKRLAEAEPLMRRGLAIEVKSRGPDHPLVANQLVNLAMLLHDTNRLAEAEPLMRRALAIDEKSFGPEHPNVARDLNGLALLLEASSRYGESEVFKRRALTIDEKAFGLEHPTVARDLNNLAQLLQATNRPTEAEPLYRRVIAIFEKSLGADHPNVATALGNLAGLLEERDDWAAAAALRRRAKTILVVRRAVDRSDRYGLDKALLANNTWAFRAHARAIYRASAESNASREEGFELAQWALQTTAAQALSQMSARLAKGAGPLAHLAREHQDFIARRGAEDKHLLAAVGRGDAPASEIARKSLASLDAALDAIDARLSSEFKEYAELSNPKPLTLAASQALLNDGEALVLFLDVPQFRNLPGENLIWVVTKAHARWARIQLASEALAERTAALRCGLDRGAWEGEGRRRCLDLLAVDVEPDGDKPLPFDLTRAHQLYQALFGQVEGLIKGKHLLIVPSGPLTQVPFHVLVTEQSDLAATGAEALRRAAWFAKSISITVLPSVSSLKALRDHAKTSHATKPFVGFGNPLLDGPDNRYGVRAEMARAKQQCAKAPAQRVAGRVAGGMKPLQQRGGIAEVADIRIQVPLPETADELCTVARDLGVSDNDIWLGARANEREIKRLSDSGQLASYRIVHFATHGALAGELNAGAEPGLILTPPSEATPEDDGYLSASEIAGLKLDADWVILSACNTAAGGAEGAEALSGVSRAFFYAGARALLVSHWAVNSDATVKLVTNTLNTMAADRAVSRSEALRRSMVALIEHGEPHEAHPAYWAPFVVVGEGGRTGALSALPVPVPGKPTKTTRKARSKENEPWTVEIWKKH